MNTLTPMQQRLWSLFEGRQYHDVSIDDMYAKVYDPAHLDPRVYGSKPVLRECDGREKQQKLGPILQRLNRKLYGWHIEPGVTKRTYRLVAKQSV